jgi:hypothetical protein
MDYENMSFGWSYGFNDPTYEWQEKAKKKNEFYNPATDHSIKPAKFLGYFNTDFEPPNYTPATKHFHFPIESMLKLIPFKRLMGIRWDTVLAERLKNNVHGCRDLLGFGERTPCQQSLSLFFNKYMGVDGHFTFFEKTLLKLKNEMELKGIKFGERLGIDSTPLPVMKNDDTGDINVHYYETFGIFKMVKIHIITCLDTGIPIGVAFSGGTNYDGDYLIPLIKRLTILGFKIKEVYGDGHYNSFKNWATLNVIYGIDCYFNMPKISKYKIEGSIPSIKRRYQSYHNEEDWIQTDDEKAMMVYLIRKEDYVYVGGHFRNKWWRIWKYHRDEYDIIKGERNKCENTNSILKEQMLFEKNIDGKGWNKIKIYTLQFMITMVTVALVRAENGVREGFNRISEGVFS